ncbi:MAG: hypothetical protein GX660_04165, partial [Clostridiaceae bacterium]|nr:hypothetical protein [Clostridiaceae bacterium]
VLPSWRIPLADLNGDGKVNSTDYALLKRVILGTATLPGNSGSGGAVID